MKYLFAAIYVIFTTGGITFMKLGGDSLKLNFKDGIYFSMGWKTFIGFVLYLVSFLLWQRLIVKYDLSTVVPIVTGIVQIVVLLVGYIVLKENMSLMSIIGAFIIILGIIIMAFAKK